MLEALLIRKDGWIGREIIPDEICGARPPRYYRRRNPPVFNGTGAYLEGKCPTCRQDADPARLTIMETVAIFKLVSTEPLVYVEE